MNNYWKSMLLNFTVFPHYHDLCIYWTIYLQKWEEAIFIHLRWETYSFLIQYLNWHHLWSLFGSERGIRQLLFDYVLHILTWFLSQELIEKLNKRELPKDEYQCMNTSPTPSNRATTHGSSGAPQPPSGKTGQPHSMRSRRTATWARTRNSDDGTSR